MSSEETKEKLDRRKSLFEYEKKILYGIENRNDMMPIHNNEVENIAECNLPHDIINPPKHAKRLNSHYSPIIHGCMNTRKGKAKFKNSYILLDSGCISTIVMRRLIRKLHPEKYAPV